jgi:hypothetical protein
MGRAARDRYERLYSPTVVLPLVLQTYGRLIASGGGEQRPAHEPPADVLQRRLARTRA